MMTNDQALVQGLHINQAHPKHGYYQIIHMFMFNVLFYILSSFYVKLYQNPLIDRFQDKLGTHITINERLRLRKHLVTIGNSSVANIYSIAINYHKEIADYYGSLLCTTSP